MTEALKEAIEKTGVTYAELERETGVTRASIMRFMRGETSLRLDLADRLAEYLSESIPYYPESGRPDQIMRLKLYQTFARFVLEIAKKIDDYTEGLYPHSPAKKLEDDHVYRTREIAELIEERDRYLLGMLRAQKLNHQIKNVCIIFAHIIMDHELEEDLSGLAEDLKRVNM